MIYYRLSAAFLISFLVFSCHHSNGDKDQIDLDQVRNDIIETEKAFSDMASEKGLHDAFVYFAADSGSIKRGKEVLTGKKAISEYYGKESYNNVKLSWKPDFVDVSSSGDLGYTYGQYTFIRLDSLGNETASQGIFHTVWKRQSDGNWRYVYD